MQCTSYPAVLAGFVLLLSFAALQTPSVAGGPAADPFLVYVARMNDDGTLSSERNAQCDARVACEVPVVIGRPDLDSVMVRVTEADTGGFSVVQIGSDRQGRLAFGRRQDVFWGPAGSVTMTIPARPLRPAPEDDERAIFGLTMRDDLPEVARIVVAVKDLRRAATQR